MMPNNPLCKIKVLRCTHEYFDKVLRNYSSTCMKMSTQELLEYFVNTKYSGITRVLRLSTRNMSDVLYCEHTDFCYALAANDNHVVKY